MIYSRQFGICHLDDEGTKLLHGSENEIIGGLGESFPKVLLVFPIDTVHRSKHAISQGIPPERGGRSVRFLGSWRGPTSA